MTNLVVNPGFESGVSPWSQASGTIAQSAAYAHSGSHSGLLTPASNAAEFAQANVSGVIANANYTIGGWVYAPASLTGSPYILWLWQNSSGSEISSVEFGGVAVTPGEWTQLTDTATAPAGATQGEFVVLLASPVNTDITYWDDFQVTQVVNVPGSATLTQLQAGTVVLTQEPQS